MLKLYAQALLKEGPYRKGKIRHQRKLLKPSIKLPMELGLQGGFAVYFSTIRSIGLSLWRLMQVRELIGLSLTMRAFLLNMAP
jgi:hypothetical protein